MRPSRSSVAERCVGDKHRCNQCYATAGHGYLGAVPNPLRFALLGAAGYIAPRHLAAIASVGGELVAAHDPHDSVGILDRYAPAASFFTEYERFDRHLELLRARGEGIDYLVVCSPNHLHDAHCRLGLRLGADVICEKPVTLNPWNLDTLLRLEEEHGQRVWCILQSRLHASYRQLREVIRATPPTPHQVNIRYITPRGPWYRYSWKGDIERSGGVLTNIGVHLFDVLLSLFGEVTSFGVSLKEATRAQGQLTFQHATAHWSLSVDANDLPLGHVGGALRRFEVDGVAYDFSGGFEQLHVDSYRNILAGNGFGLADARPAIALTSQLRSDAAHDL